MEYYIEAVIEVPPESRQRAWDGRCARAPSGSPATNTTRCSCGAPRAGQCFYQPFFGCREFSVAEWELVEQPPEKIEAPWANENFGMVFRDFDFKPMWDRWQPGDEQKDELHPFVPRPATGWEQPGQRPVPTHLPAKAVNGWITVEERSSV
ncbi:MAG: hypothetical protein V9H26_03375 [Verrucomicrobiota bacterium]